MKVDVLEELANITTINKSALNKLVNQIAYVISDSLVRAIKQEENSVEADIGIGILLFTFDNTEVKYKFTPNKNFDKIVCGSIEKEQNLLNNALEKAIVDKFINIYKDLF